MLKGQTKSCGTLDQGLETAPSNLSGLTTVTEERGTPMSHSLLTQSETLTMRAII